LPSPWSESGGVLHSCIARSIALHYSRLVCASCQKTPRHIIGGAVHCAPQRAAQVTVPFFASVYSVKVCVRKVCHQRLNALPSSSVWKISAVGVSGQPLSYKLWGLFMGVVWVMVTLRGCLVRCFVCSRFTSSLIFFFLISPAIRAALAAPLSDGQPTERVVRSARAQEGAPP
jgi:hypothetical protein